MTPAYTAALAHYKTSSGWHGMPWEADEVVIDEAFRAGWEAGQQAMRAATAYIVDPATVPQFAPVAQPVEQLFCKQPVLSSNLGGGSLFQPLTAEEKAAGYPPPRDVDIYAAYPRKVGRAAALRAIQRALRNIGGGLAAATLLERTKAYAAAVAQWPAADKQFIPHPATWFNRGSYDDDPKEWLRGAAAAPSQFSRKAH